MLKSIEIKHWFGVNLTICSKQLVMVDETRDATFLEKTEMLRLQYIQSHFSY